MNQNPLYRLLAGLFVCAACSANGSEAHVFVNDHRTLPGGHTMPDAV